MNTVCPQVFFFNDVVDAARGEDGGFRLGEQNAKEFVRQRRTCQLRIRMFEAHPFRVIVIDFGVSRQVIFAKDSKTQQIVCEDIVGLYSLHNFTETTQANMQTPTHLSACSGSGSREIIEDLFCCPMSSRG
jgi:hypothetical protein